MRATGSGQYRAAEFAADRLIHWIGTLAGALGSAALLGIAAAVADRRIFAATLVYCVCLLAMLVCSAAYNLAADGSRRGFLRRLDHAAIFLMIAGTYTPFTTCRLHGVWAIGMTGAVWAGAVGGVLYSIGAGFHLWRALPFHDAVWHSLVLSAAGCHYAAILHGVVLARS